MLFKLKKKLESIRNNWGKPVDKYRSFEFISLYHQAVSTNFSDMEIVDHKTWNDLNFDDIFTIMDRNASPVGQQYLYHLLHKYENDKAVLNERFNLIEYLKDNSGVRESLQLELTRLDDRNSNFIAPLIFGDLPERPKYNSLFYVLSYSALLSVVLTIFNTSFLFLVLVVFVTNLIVNNIFSKKIHKYFAGFASLNLLFITSRKMNKIKDGDIKELEFLKSKSRLIKKLNKKIGSMVLDKAAANEMLAGIIDYLNIYFLYDILKYSTSVGILKKYQKEIREIYENVARIDSSISVASYVSSLPVYCKPGFTANNAITFTDIYHPLIPNAVSNSLEKLEKSALITGSNMAGKTTFIKKIGVNFILAHTFNFCLSKSASIPKLIVKSAINREEDLENSKSYFFVEVEQLQQFLELSNSKSEYLFLIDEIFRGTNTVERLAASTAVLEYLNKNNLVLVTTHDIELQELLNGQYAMFHFSGQIEGRRYFYDYKIQHGPTSSGNAIKLLEIQGYPESIVQKAQILSSKLLISK